MTQATYGYTKILKKAAFDEIQAKVTEALKQEGFGILWEIDVKKTMREKLNIDFRNYKILGACNPSLAHHALTQELMIGLLLPCNVVLFEEDDGKLNVSIAKPKELFQVVSNPSLESMAEEVDQKLQRVLERI